MNNIANNNDQDQWHLFAISYYARHSIFVDRGTEICTEHQVSVIKARNEEEALGKGYKEIWKLYRKSKGWEAHDVRVIKIDTGSKNE